CRTRGQLCRRNQARAQYAGFYALSSSVRTDALPPARSATLRPFHLLRGELARDREPDSLSARRLLLRYAFEDASSRCRTIHTSGGQGRSVLRRKSSGWRKQYAQASQILRRSEMDDESSIKDQVRENYARAARRVSRSEDGCWGTAAPCGNP